MPAMLSTRFRRSSLRRPSVTLGSSSVLLFPVRMFLGFGWLRAGVEKMIDGSWWTGDYLSRFLIEQRTRSLPFMEPLIDNVFEPFAEVISLVVMLLQLAIGIAFVTGRRLRPALWIGVTLNVVFVAMGAVDPSVFYIVIQLSLLAAVSLGVFGGSRREPNPISLGLKVGAAAALAPLAMTVHPAEVIHDPAIILVTVALLAAATEALGWFVHTEEAPQQQVSGPVGRLVTA